MTNTNAGCDRCGTNDRAAGDTQCSACRETIDLTPTWTGILPNMLAVLENEGAAVESRKAIEAELFRMARLADKYVAAVGLIPSLPSQIDE